MGKEVRRRKKNNNSKSSDETDKKSVVAADEDEKKDKKTSTENNNNKKEDTRTLKQVFFEHPLVVVLPWFAIPYMIYHAYYYLLLQPPLLLLNLGIPLRPAVAIHEPRQVLIVGSMSSGTVQVAHDLSSHLGLEIGHESSNSLHEFVRDGTVSWIHILRYLEPPVTADTAVMAYTNLCQEFMPQMGFHPAMYRPSHKCSQREKWSKCWKLECYKIIKEEWGCALPATQHRQQQCLTPFVRVLHQVRHPVRTIESLVAKFCQGGLNGTVSPAFTKLASALFFHQSSHNFTQGDDSCIEAASHYVLAYNHAMLDARTKHGLVHAMFQVETTTPCDIARMAGLLVGGSNNDEDDNDDDKVSIVVYPPNAAKVATICSPGAKSSGAAAQQRMTSQKHKINVGLVSLDWEDFHGGKHGSTRPENETSLERDVRQLVEKLGYDLEKNE